MSFADAEYAGKRKQTRKELFLIDMDQVVPWNGFPLANLLKAVEPNANAKFVYFETLNAPNQMPGQKRSDTIDWPRCSGP